MLLRGNVAAVVLLDVDVAASDALLSVDTGTPLVAPGNDHASSVFLVKVTTDVALVAPEHGDSRTHTYVSEAGLRFGRTKGFPLCLAFVAAC